MVVYIEDCLIENFVVTFLILKSMCLMFKFTISKVRLFTACILASILATIYPLFYLSGILLILLKLCIGVIITAIAFNDKIFSKFIMFMIFTAIYGGLNVAIYYIIYGAITINNNFPTYILLIMLLAIYYLVSLCIKVIQKQAAINNFVYKVRILDDKNQVETKAFLDSGNTLLDQDSTPILIINYSLFNKLYSDIQFDDLLTKNFKTLKNPHYVKSAFASGGANLLVFCVDEVQIDINNSFKILKNAKLGVSYAKFNKNFNCDMLLNINIFV